MKSIKINGSFEACFCKITTINVIECDWSVVISISEYRNIPITLNIQKVFILAIKNIITLIR